MTVKEWMGKNYLQLIIIAGFIVFGLKTCGGDGSLDKPKNDTVYRSHTEYIPQPPVYIPTYIPTQSNSQAPIIIPPQYQPSQDGTVLIKQYQDLVNRFLSQNIYKDSISLKDSSGKNVGIVNLEDVVSENQIKSRKPSYQLNFPVTTNTVTITKYPLSKPQFYIGGSIQGNQLNPFNQAGLGLLYKSKKDAVWIGQVNYNFTGGINYQLGRYFKLSFNKK